ncbi:MAG: hypothetical protein ACU84H_16150 [Gammaproteobacteria bacterium]
MKVSDRAAELKERQRILLDILRLAGAQGVQFAFPTQTLHIESLPKKKQRPPRHHLLVFVKTCNNSESRRSNFPSVNSSLEILSGPEELHLNLSFHSHR